ncbi:PREDICTED: homeobox protein Hox-C5-like [Rhagoletis zephyria]|uniref:homeobox protein Hox-C5-like n=1 Tax=Rhagoletis zephyria TaxID=28612 RepID=UPI00081177C3|nr:PREDICTED: homeobox protein Hox-C5-like [Rhagoletis zephyria]
MPQLATAMHSVPLSCPLYLDVNNGAFKPEHNNVFTKAPFHEATDTSKNMLEMSFLYENFVKGQANMYQLNPNLLAESFNYYLNQNCRRNEKSVSPKSFSIESILGFPNSSPHSSTSSKDVFCNQFTLADFPASSGHCQVSATEFVTCADSYRQPLTGHVFESAKAKEQMTNIDIGSGMATEKTLSSLKHGYPGLNRKSGKVFKSSAKPVLSSQSKSKRVRTIFTPEQLERLETEFERQQYMVGTGRHYLASTLNLTEAQVKVWFQNRRIKYRKQHLDGQQCKSVSDENELL